MRARLMTRLTAALPAIVLAIASGPASARPVAAVSTAAHAKRVCATPVPGRDECMAMIRTNAAGQPLAQHSLAPSSLPFGYGPAQLRSAYQLAQAAATRGGGQTVAIVDAFDDPNAEADLATYRSTYGLPACTTANGCFRKVNQAGAASPLPAPDAGWATEISLDLDMVSAVCPNCHILLVEGNDNHDTSLAASVATAARLHATEISNSYGEPEYAGETKLEPFYHQPGVQVTASAGDSAYGTSYPAASANVTAVGGTTLVPAHGGRGWTESAWAATGSGCSTVIAKPTWQHDACTHRTIADVSAVADPQTSPVAMYDSYGGAGGWLMAGGTSVSSPIVAGVYALLGDPHTAGGSYFYGQRNLLFDVTSGGNGVCSPAYLCTAGPGYDGPTGLGTPDLTGAPGGSNSCVGNFSAAPEQAAPSQRQLMLGFPPISDNNAIQALSAADVWTAGNYLVNDFSGPAGSIGWVTNTEHWDGAKWTHVPSPTPVSFGGTGAQLYGMSFDSAKDGWAVGQNSGSPLAEHWNGSRWTMTPVLGSTLIYHPTAGVTNTASALAVNVAAISPNDAWLMGQLWEQFPGSLVQAGSLIEHWDGSTWSMVPLPGGELSVALNAMHAFGDGDIWALGVNPKTGAPVTMHYNGHAWSVIANPVTNDNTELNNISGSGPDDIWVVGDRWNTTLNAFQPWAEHWNGHTWSVTPVAQPPTAGPLGNEFEDVLAFSPTNAWAVGRYWGRWDGQMELRLYLLEHWNGHTWTIRPTPQPENPGGLYRLSASGPGNIWISATRQIPNTPGLISEEQYTLRSGCAHA